MYLKISYQDLREGCTGERTKNKKLTEDELKEHLKVIYSSDGFIGLTPQNLKIIAIENNFRFDEIVGMKFNLFFKKWSKSNDTSVNYISTFLKN